MSHFGVSHRAVRPLRVKSVNLTEAAKDAGKRRNIPEKKGDRPRAAPGVAKSIGLCVLLSLHFAASSSDSGPVYTSPLLLVADPAGKTIYVADETGSRILQVDLGTQQVVARMPLPERPTGLALNKAGNRLYVTSHSPTGAVFVIDPLAGKITSVLQAGHTTMAPVLSANESLLYVCNRFDDDLSIIDLKSGKEVKRLKMVREPVAAALTPDGKILAVANLHPEDVATRAVVASTVNLVDTVTNRVTASIRLPDGSQGIRGIGISPDNRYVFVSHIIARNHVPATQLASGWLNTHGFSIVDLAGRKLVGSVILDEVSRGAANPWGIACTQDGKQLWVALSGTHELAVIDLPGVLKRVREFNRTRKMEKTKADSSVYVEKTYTDLRFLEGLSRRVKLRGNGPRAMAISAGRLFAGMYFSETLESIDLQNPEAGSQSIALSSEKPMTAIRRGELLFHDASIAFQNWQSCSTCHQDGRSDGLNWDLTNDGVGNTKNTKSLLFAGKTPPMTMTGMLASLEKCVRFELKTILFTALPDEDAQAIVSYLKSLRPVASPHLKNGKQTASTLRGKEIFRKAKCANCHKGEYFTSMEKKNVGTHVLGDQRRSFDVPTLREVWRTAPYLHHGRAATIREVIREFNPQDRHGEVSKLSDQEIIDLVNYVLSL